MEYLTVNVDKRQIEIPKSIEHLGVKDDNETRTLKFKMPSIYKGLDMSGYTIEINYINAEGYSDSALAQNVDNSAEEITFEWCAGGTAYAKDGKVRFLVYAYLENEDGIRTNEWHTTWATLPVLDGGNVNEQIAKENPRIIEEMLRRLDALERGGASEESIKQAVNKWLDKNPVQSGATPEQAEQIEKNRQDIVQLSANINKLYAESKVVINVTWKVGNLSTVGDSIVTNNARLYNEEYISMQQKIIVDIAEGYQFSYRTYNADKTFSDWADWNGAGGGRFTIPATEKEQYLRFVLKKDDGSVMQASEGVNVSVSIEKGRDNAIKILGIGNSHTRDSLRWLYPILIDCGYNPIVGHGYWGGSSLKMQYEAIEQNTFQYWKYTDIIPIKRDTSLADILKDETWDVVVFQQDRTGSVDFSKYSSSEFEINDFIAEVKERIGNNALKIGLMSLWSNATDYTGEPFVTMFGSNPDEQLAQSKATTKQVATHMTQCNFIVNSGDAIANARKELQLKDIGNKLLLDDGNHLAHGLPMYISSLCYAVSILGINMKAVSFYPTKAHDAEIESDTTAYLAYLAKECVHEIAEGSYTKNELVAEVLNALPTWQGGAF